MAFHKIDESTTVTTLGIGKDEALCTLNGWEIDAVSFPDIPAEQIDQVQVYLRRPIPKDVVEGEITENELCSTAEVEL